MNWVAAMFLIFLIKIKHLQLNYLLLELYNFSVKSIVSFRWLTSGKWIVEECQSNSYQHTDAEYLAWNIDMQQAYSQNIHQTAKL